MNRGQLTAKIDECVREAEECLRQAGIQYASNRFDNAAYWQKQAEIYIRIATLLVNR